MDTTLSPPISDVREYRRYCAWNLHQQGMKQQQIAQALGVTQGAVSQWLKAVRQGGSEALQRRRAPGAKPRLSSEQRAQLPALLERGAEAFGFRGDVWTRGRIRQVIKQQFGVLYHVSHITRLRRQIGWSRQKPARQARQRNEEAIQKWRTQHCPALKKSAKTKAARPSS